MPRWIFVILAGAMSVVSVIAFSRNFACAAVPACVAVMVVVTLLDRAFFRVIGGKDAARDAFRLLIALTSGLVVAFIPPFRLTPASAFRTVFDMSPPPGVTNLTAESRYAGGPGDHVILLSFHADKLAIDQLIGKLGADVDRRYTQVWDADAGRDWSQFLLDRNVKVWDHNYRGPWISRQPPMTNPWFYSKNDPASERDTRIIRDADSGFTLVMFGKG